MKSILSAVLTAAILIALLSGCGSAGGDTLYEITYLTCFDTVTTLKGTAESPEAFAQTAAQARDRLERYHQLFDIYNDYPGITNLKTVNDNAGLAPVTVDPEIIALLRDCQHYHGLTGGKTNAMLGSVLQLWHEARSFSLEYPDQSRLPDAAALEEAARHTDIQNLQIDEAASTVYLSDPQSRLDVGAVAKGWAAQRIAESLPSGYLLTVGGNVCATGAKAEGQPWVIGIRDPGGSADTFLHTLNVSGGSAVTSGDYQRFYWVDGRMYHHIIDPETGMPGAYWRSVTVVCPDSALADALSTALFLMPLEEGMALAEEWEAEVFWVDSSGSTFQTPGFQNLIRS